ncbi:MAG TPA: Holliday junction branch migration protein RuvA [Nitrospiria bacterium]|nr:Holliday junction branch migration protein RuvA [Nitrospiria bacterium]
MISSLTGVLTFKSPEGVEVEVNGVGYLVYVPLTTFYRLPELKQSVTLHTHTYLREEAIQLFGFLTRRERRVFLLLLGVSGVGPRVALNVLSGIEVDAFIEAVRREDTARLVSIPGIGKKTAARVLLELKEKLAPFAASEGKSSEFSGGAGPVDDALSALVNLGYQRAEAKNAVERMANSLTNPSVEDLIKGALKALNKG